MSNQVNQLEKLFSSSNTSAEYAQGFFGRVAELMKNIDAEKFGQIVELIEETQHSGKTTFFAGNGGSGAVAGHIVNDLTVNNIVDGQPGFRSFSLTDNASSITACSNDSSFDDIFKAQLRCVLSPGDLLVALSVSGNSENIIRAVNYVNDNGGITIGLSGFDGGKLAKLAKLSIVIPSSKDEYGPVEDIFSNLGHVLTGYLTMKRGRKLSH